MLEDILLPDSYKMSMIALPDRSYIIQQDSQIGMFGEAYLLKDGEITQICENNQSVEFCRDSCLGI